MTGNSSVLDPVPLRMVRLRGGGAGEASPSSDFKLPVGWAVELKNRSPSSSRPNRTDRYYVEESTGKKFGSLTAVEQYLEKKPELSTPKPSKRSPEKKSPKKKSHKKKITPSMTGGSSDFVLPDGWTVEAHRRVNSNTVDKYYIEPETGKKFRSVIAVKRYLKEAGNDSGNETESETEKRKSRSAVVKKRKSEARFESAVESLPSRTMCSANFVLPDDWVVEKHRRTGKSSHMFDKYYIEPKTGLRFRSLVSVERYLNEKQEEKEEEEEEDDYDMCLKDFKRPKKLPTWRVLNAKSTTVSEEISSEEASDSPTTKSDENTPSTPKEATPDNDSGPSENSDTPKKTETETEAEAEAEAVEETEAPKDDFGSPPSTVNWVLAGPAGDMWNPYLKDVMVPESTKQKWSETFVSSLNNDDGEK